MRRDQDIAGFLAHPEVREEIALGPSVGVMALHGGLEFSTSRLARKIAAEAPASFYGVIQTAALGWHVTSTRFSRASTEHLGTFLDHVRFVVSLHGFHRAGLYDTILLGGSNRERAAHLGRELRREGYLVIDDLDEIPAGLRGMHPRNPVNLAREGGVQVELPRLLRRSEPLSGVVKAIATVLTDSRHA